MTAKIVWNLQMFIPDINSYIWKASTISGWFNFDNLTRLVKENDHISLQVLVDLSWKYEISYANFRRVFHQKLFYITEKKIADAFDAKAYIEICFHTPY